MCDLTPTVESNTAFLILYYDDEVLKPSNTGKLIADLIDDTYAFIWQRTEVEPELLKLLSEDHWFPVIVFPEAYADATRTVLKGGLVVPEGKRVLFILLDGSWREAKKMFRKSPYLNNFPVYSVDPIELSRYQVRKAARDHQLATAEVASVLLRQLNEPHNAEILEAWFDLFSYRYQKGVMKKNRGDPEAESRLRALVNRVKP
jgi:DTW domain-containing protein YfiP